MVHLHVRSSYTLLSSTFKVRDIVQYAKLNHMSSIALVDYKVMHGTMSFYDACIKEGIKPIFGLEFSCIHGDKSFDYILYAKNNKGMKQLVKLSSYLNMQNNVLTFDQLKKYNEDLILTTAGSHDDLHAYLLQDDIESIRIYMSQVKQYFSSFYVAIAMNDSGLIKIKNEMLKQVANELQVPTFALSRIYCRNEDDEIAYQTLCAIAQKKTLHDATLDYSSKRYFRSEEEMKALYAQEDLIMSEHIANLCNVDLSFDKVSLPVFENKYNVDSNTYLRNLCKAGLSKRLNNCVSDAYVSRLSYELDVISSMGFSDYFLIVYDFIRYAKSKGIYVGPGRGSAAGSLVSYCLGITQVDPLEYDLLFERFLNPERISMPDIDIDFPDNRRDEVIQYVVNKYGRKHVAHIITFGTLGAKQVIRDVGKVLMVPPREIDMMAKLIPNAPKITLPYTYENNTRFRSVVEASKRLKEVYELSLQLEGLERHTSTHAAGIVLSNQSVDEVCPFIEVETDLLSTQYTMEHLERLGLIKIDFLGLRNLTIIDEVVSSIHPTIDILKINYEDKKTLDLLKNVDTMGVFQLESEGMKNLLRQMKVSSFDEVVAAIALFRPGPMENIPLYLENKQKRNQIQYIHEDLKPILSSTYGVMIYQEQIMQVSQVMAGFSLSKADILRKAISKKKEKEIISLRQEFIQGSLQKGYSEQLATQVYELIMKFANYGFNKSHSVAYGMIAFQLAYLKANYPLHYFSSLLNSVIGSELKTSEYIFEAKKRGITTLHPSINYSGFHYHVENNSLRFPFLNIKNISYATTTILMKERKERGLFKDYFDFIARISVHRISRKVIECLIDAGALDEFNYNRISMKLSLDDALRYASLVSIEEDDQTRIDLNLVSKPTITIMNEKSSIACENEKNVLGFYLSKHPIQEVREKINALSLIELKIGFQQVNFVCMVERIKEHKTKHNDLMAFFSVSDDTAKFDVVVMPNIYKNIQSQIKKGNYILVQGKIDKERSCLAKHIECIKL